MNRPIDREPYYHGLLPREDIRAMLRKNGDFLVRTTEPKLGQPRAYVLSVMADEVREEAGIKHYIIQMRGAKYLIERYAFDSIPEMITWHDTDVVLKNAIGRQNWELFHEDIEVTKKLGEGAFGEVSLGTLRINGRSIGVAIKLAKLECLKKEQIKEIMGEARLMRRFDHPNVVKLYGVAAGREPLMIVMELADKGSLNSYLEKNPTSVQIKTEMCMGAAWGLEYLHKIPVIHRDIAARNCLYGENKVKISDFGLTVEGIVYEMDPKKKVPIRWLAPETLRTAMYTQKADCFAYGILCWEIFSNGIEPYPGMTVNEVNIKVKAGYRMEMPRDCPPAFSEIIVKHCWTDSSNDRWTMTKIVEAMERVTRLSQVPEVKPEIKDTTKLDFSRRRSKPSRKSHH